MGGPVQDGVEGVIREEMTVVNTERSFSQEYLITTTYWDLSIFQRIF